MHLELDMQACQASSPHGGFAMESTADRDTVDPRGRLSGLQCAPVGSSYRVLSPVGFGFGPSQSFARSGSDCEATRLSRTHKFSFF